MVDFARMRQEWRAGLTPEQLARVERREADEARFEAGAVDIEAVFERQEWGPAPAPKPVPAPVPIRRSSLFSQAARAARGPAASGAATAPGRRRGAESGETHVAETWTKAIRMRIEDRPTHDGHPGEIIRFIGGPTGHESYRLEQDFCTRLVDEEDIEARPRFSICMGTPGSYHGCSVSRDDVAQYLRRMRPDLFPDPGPAQSPGMR